jgi:hypothetical protein
MVRDPVLIERWRTVLAQIKALTAGGTLQALCAVDQWATYHSITPPGRIGPKFYWANKLIFICDAPSAAML